MNKFFLFIFIALCSQSISTLFGDAVIVTYLKQPPALVLKSVEEELEPEIVKNSMDNYIGRCSPSKFAKKMVQGQMRRNIIAKISGFLALYGGFSDYSNSDGLISFPLRHTSLKLYLLIVKHIKLEPIKGATVSHKELILDRDTPAKMYLFEKKEDEAKNSFWHVSEQNVPSDGRINPITMVLLTNPRNIYVPLGDFPTNNNPQMILPCMYVIGAFEKDAIILATMDIKKYFEPVETESKVHDSKRNQLLIIND